MMPILRSALVDIRAAIALRAIWITLAMEDIGDQHRRTTLGPFWLLINYLAFAGTFIFVFGATPEVSAEYAIYVATGLLVWYFIMEVITLSVTLFVRDESLIKGTTLPLSVYVMRAALSCMIRAGYALIGCAVILYLSGAAVSVMWAWSVAGLLVVLIATPAVVCAFAFVGAFFPDSQFIVANLMRIGMFATPVFWIHGGEGGIRGILYNWNPFTYFLDIVRQPIVEGLVPTEALVICLGITAAFWVAATFLLGSLRQQVALVL